MVCGLWFISVYVLLCVLFGAVGGVVSFGLNEIAMTERAGGYRRDYS